MCYYDDDSDHFMERCSLVSSVSTNATADNLPGLGRTLGVVYNYFGKKLEVQIGKVAEKMGKGPCVTAVRIERRRSKVRVLHPDSQKHATKEKKIRKDCEKLIKYTGSDVASTKLEALDQITRLAIEDEVVRNVLLIKGAVMAIEPLRKWNTAWVDIRPTLLPRCRRALVSLIDIEVHSLASELERAIQHNVHDKSPFINALARFLRHPDQAFLVVRHVARLINKWEAIHSVENLMGCFINIPPHAMVEWDLLDDLFSNYLNGTLPEWDGPFTSYANMAVGFRLPDRAAKTIHSPIFKQPESFNTGGDVHLWHVKATYKLLRGIADMNGIDDTTQIDFDFLQRLYPHPDVDRLLRRISCPPIVLLCEILYSMHPNWSQEEMRIDPQILTYLFPRLAISLDSEDDFEKQRALRAFDYLLSNDIYSRKAAINALSSTQFGGSPDYHRLMQSTELKCVPREEDITISHFRHCDADGHLLHIGSCKNVLCRDAGGSIQSLEVDERAVVRFRVSRGTVFSASSHHPVLAGITTAGEKAYVAYANSRDERYWERTAITCGSKPEDLPRRMRDLRKGTNFTPYYLDVLVLRYELDAYVRSDLFSQDGEIVADPTGPFSWKPCKKPVWCWQYASVEAHELGTDSTEEACEKEEMNSEADSTEADGGKSDSTEDGWDWEEVEDRTLPTSSVDTFHTCLDTPANG